MESVKGEWKKGLGQDKYDDPPSRTLASTVACSCGETKLLVNWIKSDYCGGYLKVTCPTCGESVVIFDDMA